MSDSNLYDDDILHWSEQQAAVIRRLRGTARGLPNELDIENVAEEIESVGRSELATVQSYIELILLHLTVDRLPAHCPFDIDDLVVRSVQVSELVERLKILSESPGRRDG